MFMCTALMEFWRPSKTGDSTKAADLVILLLLFLSSALGLCRTMWSPGQEVPGLSPECCSSALLSAGWPQASAAVNLQPQLLPASNASHTAPSHLHEPFQNVSFTEEESATKNLYAAFIANAIKNINY